MEACVMSTVLVTGATGRLGANLVKSLVERGKRVRSFVMPFDGKKSKLDSLDTEVCWGELSDFDSLRRAVDGVDEIIHLACVMVRPAGMSKSSYFDINVKGTYNLLEAAGERAGQIRRFIFASSDSTYTAQNPAYLPMDEKHPQRPFFQYGMVKKLGEDLVRSLGLEYAIPTTILRFGTVMNCDEILRIFRAGYALGHLHDAIHPENSLYVAGIDRPWEALAEAVKSPDQLVIPRGPDGRSWLHHPSDVRDTVAGIVLALESDVAAGETFNILAARGTAWEDAVQYIAERTGEEYADVRLASRWAFECDVSKARRILGYSPEFDYRRMIDDALAYRQGADLGLIPT